jgi:hypothetical protein
MYNGVDAWGASTCCSKDVFKVGSFTYCETSLGGMPMFILSLLDHRCSQMLASNNSLVDFAFLYGQMSMNPNFIHNYAKMWQVMCANVCSLIAIKFHHSFGSKLRSSIGGVVEKRPLIFNKLNKVLKSLGKVIMLLVFFCNT